MRNIIVIILIVVFMGILFLLDLPTYNNVKFLRNEVKFQENSLNYKQELAIKINQLKEIYDERKEEIEKLFYVLPLEKEIPNLIVQLEALVSENGLILNKIDFSETAKPQRRVVWSETSEEKQVEVAQKQKEYNTLDISLSLVGTYPALKNFLKGVESNIRLMEVKSISFSSQITEEKEEMFDFNIALEVYYQ